jgi:23S rRNA (cytidine1920-2'-O)/16S rRNA (cytidine1409-2'-O)-methyltransferase
MSKLRLDILLVQLNLVESRSIAQRLIMAGEVAVNGQMVLKPSEMVAEDAFIQIQHAPPFVSRGGEKLEAALRVFNLTNLNGRICVDVGSSTGGFTDCLLQHGAEKVYAVDVGYGVLHWKLRNHPRVFVMERTNARFIDGFPEKIELVTIDASFISLNILLPVCAGWFPPEGGQMVALIKPQFEAGVKDAARGKGVIRSPEIHRNVLQRVLSFAERSNFGCKGLIRSPLIGHKGNIEFLAHFEYPSLNSPPFLPLIDAVIGDQG